MAMVRPPGGNPCLSVPQPGSIVTHCQLFTGTIMHLSSSISFASALGPSSSILWEPTTDRQPIRGVNWVEARRSEEVPRIEVELQVFAREG